MGERTHTEFTSDYFGNYEDRPLFFKHFAGVARRRLFHGSKILEIGCAEGYLLKRLEGFFETYGIDISEYAIKKAKKNLPDGVFFVADANIIDISARDFDMIIALSVLEHLADPSICVGRCHALLKKDGFLVIQVPNTASRAVNWKGTSWHGYRDETHVSLKKPAEWEALLRSQGFDIIRMYGDGLTDIPYFKSVPLILQRIFIAMPSTLLFSWGFRFPLGISESTIIIAKKREK